MKIAKLYIKDYQQFKDLELDFTYPQGHEKAGEPLDKVCFIGRNGTGKTTLLELLKTIFVNKKSLVNLPGAFYLKLTNNDPKDEKIIFIDGKQDEKGAFLVQKPVDLDEVESLANDFNRLSSYLLFEGADKLEDSPELFFDNSDDLFIYLPSEGDRNTYSNVNDVPKTELNDALRLSNRFAFYHNISIDTVADFWNLLIYHIKERELKFRQFQNLENNQEKTIRELKVEFDSKNPTILDGIKNLWGEILTSVGLEFDISNIESPVQLTDNLRAYIKHKKTGERINYNQLSTGIQHFIFKLGHLYSLYFNRNVERGFLLVDEPENFLFPDFLYGLIDLYEEIIENTQFFVATHSPIIAAQYEPYERIILDFNEEGAVYARKGKTPVGDDPNDILKQDFEVRNLMGEEGVKKFERYVELKTLIKREEDNEERNRMIQELM